MRRLNGEESGENKGLVSLGVKYVIRTSMSRRSARERVEGGRKREEGGGFLEDSKVEKQKHLRYTEVKKKHHGRPGHESKGRYWNLLLTNGAILERGYAGKGQEPEVMGCGGF